MNAKRPLILVGVFGLGFTSAWFSKPDQSLRQEAPSAKATASERAERPVKEAKNPRAGELLKALGEARYNEPKTKEALDQIKTEEFPGLIEALIRKAGFTGLDYKDEKSIQDLVTAWYDRDPQAALDWVLEIENAKDRELLLSGIIDAVAKKDLKQGLALLQQYGGKEDGGWLMPMSLFQGLTQLGAEGMAAVLSKCIATDGNTSGVELTFPHDFDFRRLLDELAAIQKGLKKGQEITMVPTNVLSEWAKRDAKSAWEWVLLREKVPLTSPADFFKGYRSTVSQEEFSTFLAEVVSNGNFAEKTRFQMAWQALAQEPNAVTVDAFLHKLPGERSNSLRSLFDAANTGSGGRYDLFKEILLQQMSPDERVSVLAAHFKENGSDKKFYTPLLQQLGHSEEEIQRMLSPGANH